MAPQKLNDYERQRLENIRRNDEMMAALKLHSKAASLLSSAPGLPPSPMLSNLRRSPNPKPQSSSAAPSEPGVSHPIAKGSMQKP
ncbi:hypothetical protein PIB30_013915 [Stylosanthes scabra]|uniref:Uncharacterized protein n=1 Tax=Stylosanthes scabra TaxID=79078 RepID=A0ABU6W4L7_9FABA|nr:hypothetical protein [Stylosanthes scabra]